MKYLGKPVRVMNRYSGCVLKEREEEFLVSFYADGTNKKAWVPKEEVVSDKTINETGTGDTPIT